MSVQLTPPNECASGPVGKQLPQAAARGHCARYTRGLAWPGFSRCTSVNQCRHQLCVCVYAWSEEDSTARKPARAQGRYSQNIYYGLSVLCATVPVEPLKHPLPMACDRSWMCSWIIVDVSLRGDLCSAHFCALCVSCAVFFLFSPTPATKSVQFAGSLPSNFAHFCTLFCIVCSTQCRMKFLACLTSAVASHA
jgi:hypothetical protein